MDDVPGDATVSPMAGSGHRSPSPYLTAVAPLWRLVKFLAGASAVRGLLTLLLLYFAASTGVSGWIVLALLADLVQLSLRRGRWLFRVPMYLLAGILTLLAGIAAASGLRRLEAKLLGGGATLKQGGDALRRRR